MDEENQSGNATLIERKEGQEIIKTIITTVVFDKYRNSFILSILSIISTVIHSSYLFHWICTESVQCERSQSFRAMLKFSAGGEIQCTFKLTATCKQFYWCSYENACQQIKERWNYTKQKLDFSFLKDTR